MSSEIRVLLLRWSVWLSTGQEACRWSSRPAWPMIIASNDEVARVAPSPPVNRYTIFFWQACAYLLVATHGKRGVEICDVSVSKLKKPASELTASPYDRPPQSPSQTITCRSTTPLSNDGSKHLKQISKNCVPLLESISPGVQATCGSFVLRRLRQMVLTTPWSRVNGDVYQVMIRITARRSASLH